MTEVARRPSTRRTNSGGIIDEVREGSIAHEAGLRPGDRVLAVNGHELRDAVDFQFYAADELLTIEVARGETAEVLELEKYADEDLGLGFQDAAFDGVRTCNNACFFCFLKGNPKGMRKTLYVKDDDYRLSFFHGNFVTLTNLSEDDWARFEEQRLSPINVSVHATDVELRRYLLGNRNAPDVVEQLRRLGALGIRAHTQVVLCPGVNDGAALDRTVQDLSALYPTVETVSIVPVGATDVAEDRIERRGHADETAGVTAEQARAVLEQIAPYQRRFRREHGRTLVYLADEYYLLAGVPLPPTLQYDGFAQYENGIGMSRSMLDEWRRIRTRLSLPHDTAVRRVSFVCGTLVAPVLRQVAEEFTADTGINVTVHALENRFFGPRVNVSGLLVGSDIEQQLRGRDLGDLCVLPRYTLDYSGERFLDDRTPGSLQEALGVPLAFASSMREVVEIIRGPLESTMPVAPGERTNGKSWVDFDERPALGGQGLAKEVRR